MVHSSHLTHGGDPRGVVNEILEINHLQSADIHPGDTLVLPNPQGIVRWDFTAGCHGNDEKRHCPALSIKFRVFLRRFEIQWVIYGIRCNCLRAR